MSTKNESTPRPWELGEVNQDWIEIWRPLPDGSKEIIGTVIPIRRGGDYAASIRADKEQEANARLIVRAVNAHEGLVEALEKAQHICRKWSHKFSEEYHDAYDQINAALALARGEAPKS